MSSGYAQSDTIAILNNRYHLVKSSAKEQRQQYISDMTYKKRAISSSRLKFFELQFPQWKMKHLKTKRIPFHILNTLTLFISMKVAFPFYRSQTANPSKSPISKLSTSSMATCSIWCTTR